MIDVKKLKYQFIGISEDGTQLDITGATEDQGWEEGEGELAMRVSLTVHNTKYNGKYLSDILKPGCIIAVVADWGDGTEEVARGASLIGTPATRVPRTPFPSSPMMNFSICRTARTTAILPPVRAPRPR